MTFSVQTKSFTAALRASKKANYWQFFTDGDSWFIRSMFQDEFNLSTQYHKIDVETDLVDEELKDMTTYSAFYNSQTEPILKYIKNTKATVANFEIFNLGPDEGVFNMECAGNTLQVKIVHTGGMDYHSKSPLPIKLNTEDKSNGMIRIMSDHLKEVIKKVTYGKLHSVSMDKLDRINFSVNENDSVDLRFCNGHYLYSYRLNEGVIVSSTAKETYPLQFNINKSQIEMLSKLLPVKKKDVRPVDLIFSIDKDKSRTVVKFTDTAVVTESDNNYPKIDEVIPTEFNFKMTFQREQFMQSLEKLKIQAKTMFKKVDDLVVSIIKPDGEYGTVGFYEHRHTKDNGDLIDEKYYHSLPVDFNIDFIGRKTSNYNDEYYMSCVKTRTQFIRNRMQDDVSFYYSKYKEICVKLEYLMVMLNVLQDSETIYVHFYSNQKPLVFRTDNDNMALLMPVTGSSDDIKKLKISQAYPHLEIDHENLETTN